MELMEVIRKRRSIRRYKPDPIPEEDIQYVLEAARLAPSSANTQCWHFVVVTDEDVKKEVAQAGMNIAEAPVIIVACAEGDHSYFPVDMGIAIEHLILAATDRGLGTCWIGFFDGAKVKKALGVPENVHVVACTPLGYPDEAPAPIGRKGLEEIVSYNRYGRGR